jgi:hypothetical protein
MPHPATPIEVELVHERANALGRAMDALERSLEELTQLDAAVTAGARPVPAARRELVAECGELLWKIVVQRECIGLAHHDVVYEVLRVPADVRRSMSPRTRGRR